MISPASSVPYETRPQRWLGVDRAKRSVVYAQVYESAEISSVNYWLEIVFSAGIAVIGLVLNSPAVIIGAMLISPLMSPIMAMGLALAAGDLYLAMKTIVNLVASIALAVALSAAIVWLLPFHSITAEVLARINPNLLDLGVALFSGLAGSVAVCRAGAGSGIMTLPGVAIAVALMPPLCTMGFGLGSGANMRIMGGAGLLFLTNLVAIVSSAFAVFLLMGMNSPDLRSEMEVYRKGERFAERMSQGVLGRILSNGGRLHWRIVTLAILLGSVAVPLRTAFKQLASEAIVRGAVQEAVKGLLPAGSLVSQQIEIGRNDVAVRLVSTSRVSDKQVDNAEMEIERRSGQRASISVATVASQSELAELLARLSAPPPPPPKPPVKTIPEIQQDLLARVTPVVNSIWPQDAPLQDFSLSFSDSDIVLNTHYQSEQPLGKIALDLITRECQEKLGAPGLT
ncbi:MAG TPA: DUF389 domain-containing protein [Acidobacteriaceae bacterium]|nr:DUF389 domain-containing protein [Acidobacteriaceae bacterium]